MHTAFLNAKVLAGGAAVALLVALTVVRRLDRHADAEPELPVVGRDAGERGLDARALVDLTGRWSCHRLAPAPAARDAGRDPVVHFSFEPSHRARS